MLLALVLLDGAAQDTHIVHEQPLFIMFFYKYTKFSRTVTLTQESHQYMKLS